MKTDYIKGHRALPNTTLLTGFSLLSNFIDKIFTTVIHYELSTVTKIHFRVFDIIYGTCLNKITTCYAFNESFLFDTFLTFS